MSSRAGYADCDKGQLYYEQSGAGPDVVFLHGFTLDRRMWRPQVDFFTSRGYRTLVYDLRGFGRSSAPTDAYSHVDDLAVMLDQLRIKRVHLVGLSMGGRIAVNFALQFPDRVTSLALLDSALDGFPDTVDWDTESRKRGLEAARAGWLMHPLFAATRQKTEASNLCTQIVDDYSGWHWYHKDPQLPDAPPARTRLAEIKAPTLVMVGELDLAYFRDIAEELSRCIPRATLRVVNGAGHMINLEASSVVNQALLKGVRTGKESAS